MDPSSDHDDGYTTTGVSGLCPGIAEAAEKYLVYNIRPWRVVKLKWSAHVSINKYSSGLVLFFLCVEDVTLSLSEFGSMRSNMIIKPWRTQLQL